MIVMSLKSSHRIERFFYSIYSYQETYTNVGSKHFEQHNIYGGSSEPKIKFCADDLLITSLSYYATVPTNLLIITHSTRKKYILAFKILI